MKKVLMIACDNLGLGGIQNVIMSILRNLNEECRFDIVLFNREDRFNEEEFAQQGSIFTINTATGSRTFRSRLDYYIRPLHRYRAFRKILRENAPYDVIHCHNYHEGGLFLMAAKQAGIPVRIMHSHSYTPLIRGHYVRRIYEFVYKVMIKRYATKRIACSRLAGRYLFDEKENTIIVPNAIDLKKYCYSDCCENRNPYSIINVGRWGCVKNQLFLIDVIAAIAKLHPEVILSLVGYGLYEDEMAIRNKIKDNHLEQNVFFYPGDTDIPKRLRENNIFVFPSLFEGLGIALIEAQATGMKCFASDRVPKEADCGLVTYLPLEVGAEKWASEIMEYIDKHGTTRTYVDMSRYDTKNLRTIYKDIYEI